MKQKINLMPAIMTVLSALYFVYVIMSEDTILAADAIGGDPGGKILPAFMALFMFLGFLYLTLKEKPDGEPMDPGTKKLFFITLVMSVLYAPSYWIYYFVNNSVIWFGVYLHDCR